MLTIDKTSRLPIYEQLIECVKKQILLGLLKSGDKLPSIRELAVSLPANPNTVQKAYIEMEQSGIIEMRQGKGCFISEKAFYILSQSTREKLSDLKSLTTELALSGASLEEIQKAVEEAYKKATEGK